MRIKSVVQFVKRECMSDEAIDWDSSMESRCGETVTEVMKLSDNKVKCTFSDGDWYYYTPACLEEGAILEKGKKYTINDGINVFEFVEESENFAIFKDGYAIEKEGNTFTEYDPKPEFLKKEWAAIVEEDRVLITCGPYRIISIREDGCKMIEEVSDTLDLQIDENGAVKVVK